MLKFTNENQGRGGIFELLASLCFNRSGSSRPLDPSRLASAILRREPDVHHLTYHDDGSIKLREAFIAYMSSALPDSECAVIERYLDDPSRQADRDHWDALFEQYEDELVRVALEDALSEDTMLLPDAPDDIDVCSVRDHLNRGPLDEVRPSAIRDPF